MKHFFSQVDELSVDNSLLNAKGYFSDHKASGLIEKQVGANQTAVLVIGGGLLCAAYIIENDVCKSISLTEFSSFSDGINRLRAIQLPDTAGRMTWLALESQVENKYSIGNDDIWKNQLEKWKQDRWSGVTEISSGTLHGFALFWEGENQKSETIFSTSQGFISEFPQIGSLPDSSWEVTSYVSVPSTQAYRCAILRQGTVGWSRQILSRYREMVGQKLLQLMDRELNRQIRPWEWNISLDENVLADSHFFASMVDASHAYRSLLMAMGAQMNFVIGAGLTQKILNESFEQVHPDQRAILQSQRLIPAAFSE